MGWRVSQAEVTAGKGVERMLGLQSCRAVRGHTTLSIYNRSAQLESGIWGRARPGFKGKELKQFSSASHENTSQEEAAQMLVHNGVYSLAPNTQHLKYRLVYSF